jgi:hypothetical protein
MTKTWLYRPGSLLRNLKWGQSIIVFFKSFNFWPHCHPDRRRHRQGSVGTAGVLIPLATSLVFGLIASTVLVLLVIPAVYAILGDFGMIVAGQNKTDNC